MWRMRINIIYLFRDSVEQDCRIEIDKDIFDTYTNSKKTYIKIKNETSRHLEQSDLTEEDMYKEHLNQLKV